MNIDKVELLARQGESQTVEFKASTAQLQGVVDTLCAFLNGQGGTVLIGIKNSGEIVGQNVTDNTKQEIARELIKLEPAAKVDVHYIPIKANKKVITFQVNAGNHAPYVHDGRPYQRNESSTHRMSQHHYKQLLVERGQLNHAWDDYPAPHYDINSLDHEEIRNTIRDGINENRIAAEVFSYSIEKMLHYLKLTKNGKITNAAVVLYAKEVEPEYSQCLIRMTRYSGTTKLANFMDSKHVYGNAFKTLSEVNYFTMRHLPVASFFESNKFERIDKPALPVLAIREAVINAISHRDYSEHSASISFAIFDDRLEIWNNGTLSSKLKINDLKKPHESYPRNKRIAKIFYSRGWVEKAGIGTLRMVEDCKKLGVPSPVFKEYSSGFSVVFKFKEPIGQYKVAKKLELTTRQKELLKLLEKSPANSAEIAEKLTTSPSVRTVQIDLVQLEKAGLIKREGKARAMLWKIVK